MTTRRSTGEGGLHWSEARQRWIGTVAVGYAANGKRRTRTFSARTKTEAKIRLRELLRDAERGVKLSQRVTVAEAVEGWLAFGLNGRSEATVKTSRHLAESHIVPTLGKRRLTDLRAVDVDRLLRTKRTELATSSLRKMLSILRRVLRWAESRDMVGRNVATLCTVPTGKVGRPSRALTLDQAQTLLSAAEGKPLGAYVVLALLTGARTEELRALTWDHLDLDGYPDATPPRPPSVQVWRSVRSGGDTKTRTSRRTIALPARCIEALSKHQVEQQAVGVWSDHGYVFCTATGTPLDAANVRRSFRAICEGAGLDVEEHAWTPRELRHSFVSLLSDAGVPIESIAQLVGHRSTIVTETVYRKQLRPVLTGGAQVMDGLFQTAGNDRTATDSHAVSHAPPMPPIKG
jgi:integrase